MSSFLPVFFLLLSLSFFLFVWFIGWIFSPGRWIVMTSQSLHMGYLENRIVVENGVEFGPQFSKSDSYGHPVFPDVTDHLVFISVGKLMQS